MENTILIQVKNPDALKLLDDLEKLNLIKLVKNSLDTEKKNLSAKYKGLLTKEDAMKFHDHIQKSRDEWGNI